jgi:hypothetical protein
MLMSLSPSGIFEFIRVGSLAEHWDQHLAAESDLGIGEFLFMHYFDVEHDTTDPADHAKLPFHHQSTALVLYPNEVQLQLVINTLHPAPSFVHFTTAEPIDISIPVFHPPQG